MDSLAPEELGEKAATSPETAKIEDCRLLASFNWMDGQPLSIIFPGETQQT